MHNMAQDGFSKLLKASKRFTILCQADIMRALKVRIFPVRSGKILPK